MPGGLGWRLCLFACLLSVGRADGSRDLIHGGHDQDSRSGYLSSSENDNNDDLEEETPYSAIDSDDNRNGNLNNIPMYGQEKDASYLLGPSVHYPGHENSWRNEADNSPGPYVPGLTVNTLGRDKPWVTNEANYPYAPYLPGDFVNQDHGNSWLKDEAEYSHMDFNVPAEFSLNGQYAQPVNRGSSKIHDEFAFSKDPNYETRDPGNEYSLTPGSKDGQKTSKLGITSRIISAEEHIQIQKIPGAKDVMRCSKVGELHQFWAPNFHCMICVCLKTNHRLRPVCVSCQTCQTPGPPPTTARPGPSTTPEPEPPVPTTPSSEASCKPLPVDVPFQSPLDPCKICVCTETHGPWGKKDVRINCQHNPQCVEPPYTTTPQTDASTPIPLPVCNEFPQNVPFPHPQDPCKICKCTVRSTPFNYLEKQINCYPNPECRPDTERPEPVTELPEPVTELPEPVTDIPKLDCDGYPVNVIFQHPLDQCKVCRCTMDLSQFIPTKKITCYVTPECLSTPTPVYPTSTTQTPRPTTPYPESTPAPQPDNVRCAPLPTGTPFQNPLNPCQICVCTERADLFGRIDVQIKCQENPKCVLPDYATTLPPEIVTPVPLPACKEFPENVPFPHPQNECQECKCTVINNPLGIPVGHINCYTKPECLPTPPLEPVTTPPLEPVTTPPLEPVTTPPPEPVTTPQSEPNCDGYPVNVIFQHPSDACKVCRCTMDLSQFIPTKKVTCYVTPHCASTPITPPVEPTTELTPENVRCAPLPTGTPFQNPLNPCQICVCTERADLFGRIDVQIKCQEKPKCELPDHVTTLPPETDFPTPLPACKAFPENVPFPHPHNVCQVCKCTVQKNPNGVPVGYISCYTKPECMPTPPPEPVTTQKPESGYICDRYPLDVFFSHPSDQCKVCKCYRNLNDKKIQINCFLKPECVQTPRPPHTTPGPTPKPDKVSCAPLPVGRPFQNPLDPCQTCVCTERVNPYGERDVKIECKENPNCVYPPDTTTLSPDIIGPEILPACKYLPENVLFPHPRDACKLCKCAVHNTPYGSPEEFITCFVKPECLPTELPGPTTELPEPKPSSCAPLPTGTPFQNPLNPCQVCVCAERVDSSGAHDVKIQCQQNPECVLPPDVSTLPPSTDKPERLPACKQFPHNVPFSHPEDECLECRCIFQQNQSGNPEEYIICNTKPECIPTPEPVTEEPDSVSFCKYYPTDVPFTDPRDPCQSCVCYYGPPRGVDPLSPVAPVLLHMCQLKPECYPPTSEPQTISPEPDVVPASCKPLPAGRPFQNPLNPCQVCVCSETVDAFGTHDVTIKCQENPECVTPSEVTTIPPTPDTSPIPLPACAKFPTNVTFPHPLNPCKLCKCTVKLTAWGVPEQLITCYTKPNCEPEPGPATVQPPEPSICDHYPADILFPLPQDHCKLCRCTVESTPHGETKKVTCFVNPACSPTPPSTTLAPLPPEPPGPLPGPAPHESCSPYKSNQPFQHPWDECQVCVCKEAISTERITIEVNCYTKPSCCIEIPFDTPGLPGSAENVIEKVGGNVIGPSGGNSIGPSGGNIIENTVQNAFGPSGNLFGPPNNNIIGPSGGNTIGPSGGNIIAHTRENMFGPSANLFRPTGGQWFGPPAKNIIGPSGGNTIGPSGGNVIKNTGGNLFGPSSHLFRPPDNNIIGPSGGNAIGPSGGNVISAKDEYFRPIGEKRFGPPGIKYVRPPTASLLPNGENWNLHSSEDGIDSSVENIFRPSIDQLIKKPADLSSLWPEEKDWIAMSNGNLPGGNMYVHNRGSPLINESPTPAYNIRPGHIIGDQIHQHNFPVINGLPIYHGDPRHENIPPEIKFMEGDGLYHHLLPSHIQQSNSEAHAYAEGSAGGQSANANAKATAFTYPYKGSTKMRPKSGKPSIDSDSDSIEYD